MRKVYLDNACSGIPPERVLACAEQYVKLYRDSDKAASDITRELRGWLTGARETLGRFLNCGGDEIAIVESTSHALGILSQSIPLEKHDNILVCDLEYQASTICWKRRREQVGFELREVKTQGGAITPEDFARAADADTKVILLAAVQEINGFRADVKAIRDFARDKGILFIVDGIQEVGAMSVDLADLDIDVYCAGGKKWLCNPFGAGFLYVNKRRIPDLPPPFYSYFNIVVDEKYADYITYLEDPSRHPFDRYTILDNASKYENGGYANYLGALGLQEACKVQMEIGQEAIEATIRKLQRRLLTGLREIGLTPSSPTDDARMSSIATFNFGLKDGVEKERRLVKFLERRGVYVSLRCSTGTGGIRMSPHYYNTEEDVDILLDGISEFLARDGR